MPSLQEIEAMIAQAGKPIQQGAAALAAPIDSATDARIKAAQQIASQQQMPQMPVPSQQMPPNPAVMNTGATPGMGGGDSSVPLTFDAMARHQAAMKKMYAPQPAEVEPNPDDYREVETTAQRQAHPFQKIQDKIQSQKPISQKDIHQAVKQHQKGLIELSDDPEEAEKQIEAARGE